MLTEFDKALVAVLLPVVVYVNQKYGFTFPVDPQVLGYLVAGITAALVYVVPNKPKGA